MAYNKKMGQISNKLLRQLVQARKTKGWTQAQLGMRLGMPQSHVSQMEQGQIDLRSGSLNEWARALDFELVLVPRQLLPAVQHLLHGEAEEQSLAASLLNETSDDE